MNICIYVSVGYIYTYRVALLAHRVALFNFLWTVFLCKLLDCFPKWLQCFILPPASIQSSNSSTFLPTLTLVSEDQSSRTMSLVQTILVGGEEVSHVICIALMSDEVKLIFTCSLAKATGSCEYGSLDTAAFYCSSISCFYKWQSWAVITGPLRMGLHSVEKPSKWSFIQ